MPSVCPVCAQCVPVRLGRHRVGEKLQKYRLCPELSLIQCDLRRVLPFSGLLRPSCTREVERSLGSVMAGQVAWEEDVRAGREQDRMLCGPAASDSQGGRETSNVETAHSLHQRGLSSQPPPFLPGVILILIMILTVVSSGSGTPWHSRKR